MDGMDRQILCFKHCGTIFCFDLPEVCPLCHFSLSLIPVEDIPFRLPHPFVKAGQYPCSIVIKSTTGTFLENYNYNKNLHIGVTDSRGAVHEYDSGGLRKNCTQDWNQSIVVYKSSEVWRSHWDSPLAVVYADPMWRSENYDEDNFNCFSFVIAFLKKLNCKELNEFMDKE
ncbi:MKRN2 opposite strand protein [Coccinella septempunctata]|uniref:MKRN2 opposite strand protein n=1 Tax=Coccinella septempunctata TaxID=41139 RepID=UPI001D07B2FE|nr:MKRN2 opposite strand protein [Coccinella septempunctata]